MRESIRAVFELAALLTVAQGCGARSGLEAWELSEEELEELLSCPSLEDPPIPTATVGNDTELDGWLFTAAPIVRWQWRVEPEGCDAILPEPRYRLRGETESRPVFNPARPGRYRFHLQVEALGGATAECAFDVFAENEGLLVELCWDTSTTADLDLYLHRPSDSAPWFAPGSYDVLSGLDSTTCNSANCAAGLRYNLPRAEWGYPDSELGVCQSASAFADFGAVGRCPNPRSAEDNNQVIANGTAEVIQLDNPGDGDTFRVMVQNFENLIARPTVRVYCGSRLASESAPPLQPPGFQAPNPGGFGVMWRPVDVTLEVGADGATTGCAVTPLRHPNGGPSYVTTNDPVY